MVGSPDVRAQTTPLQGAKGIEIVSDLTASPSPLAFRPVEDRSPISALMIKHCGSVRMLVGMYTYDVTEIEASGLFDENDTLMAFASWTLRDKNMVLCALHTTAEGNGYARQMLERLKEHARTMGARAIRSMVTNDNMPALAFYQKSGFRLSTLYVGAVDAYRAVMPGMITHGYMGIPVHDALELELIL